MAPCAIFCGQTPMVSGVEFVREPADWCNVLMKFLQILTAGV